MNNTYLILCVFALFNQLYGQGLLQPNTVVDAPPIRYIIQGDTVAQSQIQLDEVVVFNRLKFKNYAEKRRYLILKRKTLKVYPYAKLASERLDKLNHRLENIKSKSGKRKYTRLIQRYVEDELSAELKKLSRTEGQILAKLIHRQTGKTAFDLIKSLRNGWQAFWYNTAARMFNISLKKNFDPVNDYEDYLIEDILQRAFAQKKLEPQAPAFNFSDPQAVR